MKNHELDYAAIGPRSWIVVDLLNNYLLIVPNATMGSELAMDAEVAYFACSISKSPQHCQRRLIED